MTTPLVPAFRLADADAAGVLITEDITVDHIAMTAVAAGADEVAEDTAVANAASTLGQLGAIST